MVVDIDKIIVKDRIRKEYGDIPALAEDIKKNGIINPPVINKDYVLIAGERRLRALKSLGMKSVEVRMMDTEDEDQDAMIEFSENVIRQDFSFKEQMEGAKRMFEIEAKKAKERMVDAHTSGVQNSSQQGKTREIVAERLGMSHDTLRKGLAILDNASLLTPEDFVDWDEGRLSTNKAYNKIREERDRLKKENEEAKEQLAEYQDELDEAVKRIDEAERKADGTQRSYQRLKGDYDKQVSKCWELEKEMKATREATPEAQYDKKRVESALLFCARVADFIEKVGGYVWLTDEIDRLPDDERRGYTVALNNLEDMVNRFKANLYQIID